MDFDRWYRKTDRKATARMWQGVVVAFVEMMVSGLFAKIGNEAGSLVRPIFEVFAWAPIGLFAIAVALMASGAWTVWRLHVNPVALYEGR
jgi:hypothetical protein